jgi:hypothetical protein
MSKIETFVLRGREYIYQYTKGFDTDLLTPRAAKTVKMNVFSARRVSLEIDQQKKVILGCSNTLI